MSSSPQQHFSATVIGEQFTVVNVDENKTNIRNDDKNTIYTVTHESGNASSCTCPHFCYKVAYCKHMAAVESTLIDSDDDSTKKEISGPYTGFDKYGNFDHTYWKCESCGAEATDEAALKECC
ncbi:SWIM zinc finger family protein [Haladaptatus cibarius]|uniref:SWIM zinc finger family protein n=1 Tax=Haladaptatus cibarius TaxID=453847 RepID=UPI0009FC9187